MARQLTQGERDELIAYMQGMKADEAFVSQRVKNVQDEGSSPRFGYLDAGDKIFTNPAAIYRTIPSIEENFESLPLDLQQQIIRGGRARDEARFMGASGGSLVTPDQRRFGLLYSDMPYMDTAARKQLAPKDEMEAMSYVVDERGNPVVTTMPAPNMPEESNKGVFAGLLNAVNGVADRVAQKRGFTQNAVNPLQTVPQANGAFQDSGAVDAGFLASQTYPTDNRLRPDLQPKVGPFDPQNPDIMSVESFDPVEVERQRDLRDAEAAQQQSRLVEGSFGGDLGVNEVISGVQRADTARTPISFDVDNRLGFKPAGGLELQGDPNDIEYQAGQIQQDLEETIPEAKEKLDFGRLAKALALGFNTLRLNPDQQLASYLGKSLEQDRQLKISRAAADRYRKAGYGQIADALMAGEITGKEAFTAYSALTKSNFEILSPEKFKEIYGTDMPERYRDYIVLRNKTTGDIEQIGSAGISIGDQIETEESKLRAKGFQRTVDAYADLGLQAKSSMNAIEELRRLNKTGRVDLLSGPLRAIIPASLQNDETQAYSAILSDLARSQRVPGSGNQSDKDVELLFQTAGAVAFNVTARNIALDALEKKTLLNAQLSELARAYNGGMIDKQQFVKKESEILNQSLFTEEQRVLMESLEKSAPVDSNALDKAFEGVSEEVVKEILADKEFLDEFLSATDEQRRNAIKQIEKDLKGQ